MIKSKIQSKVSKAFSGKLVDAVHTFTCTLKSTTPVWDEENLKWVDGSSTTYSGSGVLFGSYLQNYVKPADYQVDDCKAVILQNQVTAKPEINHVWVTAKGDFRVVSVGQDPTDSIWTVQIRKVTA